MTKQILIGFFSFFTILGFTQEVKVYESKLINTERLNIEYMDFGGEGIPLIIVQGAHNYFDESSTNPYINYENNSWISLFAGFTNNYQVVAPLKRGFGKTDAQLNEESVKESTLDLISFIDKMGFEKAFFIGRDNSAQILLELGENHPERINGLIFLDPRFVFTDVKDKATKDFIFFSYSNSFNESEYENFKMKETELYRPKIFSDTSKRIDVPALLFYNSFFSTSTLESRRIESFIQWVENEEKIEWNKEYSSIEIANYFEELSKDKERMVAISNYLQNNNPTPKMYEALKTAFGDNLVTFNETNMQVEDVKEALMKVYAPVVKAFLFMSK
jgi:pimeloyl-ACP methyl ester carboxylesterase